jgi:hypothetical protein
VAGAGVGTSMVFGAGGAYHMWLISNYFSAGLESYLLWLLFTGRWLIYLWARLGFWGSFFRGPSRAVIPHTLNGFYGL